MLSKMFSVLGGALIVTALCATIPLYYQMDLFSAVIWIFIGLMCYKGLALCAFMSHGYGIKTTRSMNGMPIPLGIVFGAMTTTAAFILYSAYQPSTFSPTTINNLKAFGWSAAIGLIVFLCHWYFYARKEYFHVMEYAFRRDCKNRNISSEETERAVKIAREAGIVQ